MSHYVRVAILIFVLLQPQKIWLCAVDALKIDFDAFNDRLPTIVRQWAVKFFTNTSLGSPLTALFVWQPSTRVADASRWLDNSPACANDFMRVDSEKIFIAILDDKLIVNSMELPESGILYFDDNKAVIGEKGDWQCERREDPQDAFIQPDGEHNFHDAKNWRIFDVIWQADSDAMLIERAHSRLHAEMVPSDTDYVIVENVSQITLDNSMSVAGFEMDGKAYDTTSHLFNVFRTMEGHLRFQLGHLVFGEVSVDAFIGMWIRGNVVHVERPTAVALSGAMPGNFREQYLSAVCARVFCANSEDIACQNPIRPVGHCCAQCGAMATFRQSVINMSQAMAAVRVIELTLNTGISFARIDQNVISPVYQLAVMSSADDAYDESRTYSTLRAALDVVQDAAETYAHELGRATYRYELRVTYSIQRGKIHWEKVLQNLVLALPLMLVLVWALRQQYRRSARFRMWLRDRHASSFNGLSVTWRRARELVELRRGEFSALGTRGMQAEFCNAAFCNASYDNSAEGDKFDGDDENSSITLDRQDQTAAKISETTKLIDWLR